MAVKLKKVVPFGRSFDEYIKMFNLSESDLNKRILGVGDGPANFNAETTKKGYRVTSVDPIYQFKAAEILQRFSEVVDNVIEQVKATPDDWVWSYHKSPDDLRKNRDRVIQEFIKDYEIGKQDGRYLIGELPKLNFSDGEYSLALCSHFLFLYSEHYNLSFHFDSIREILRVSQEVRIFPLLTLMSNPSPYLDSIVREFQAMGFQVSLEKVQYELQKGANQMLIIKR